MNKVVDYTSKDKEIIITQTQKYSGLASITLIAGILLAVFDFSNRFYQITDVLFGVSLIMMIAIFLLSSGKAAEMKKNKAKRTKYLVLALAVLVIAVTLIFGLIGVFN